MKHIFLVLFFFIGTISNSSNAIELDKTTKESLDQQRLKDIKIIANHIISYVDRNHSFPLNDITKSTGGPVTAFIGESIQKEDFFAKVEALVKTPVFANSEALEKRLSAGLGKPIRLPRDPQSETTSLPNVYMYLEFPQEKTTMFCVAAHLFNPTDQTKPYTWENGEFHSHPICMSK